MARQAVYPDKEENVAYDKTTALLMERARTHGDFSRVSSIAQMIKRAGNEQEMHPLLHESLDMIASKIGRIIAGDPTTIDHWDDIAGYAKLAADHLRAEQLEEQIPKAT